jgi:hypothetical protein
MNLSAETHFTLKVRKAFYYQFGEAHPMTIDHLNFKDNGEVFMEGEDEVGSFTITGELSNSFLYMSKQYKGAHTVYYTGILQGSIINLVYDFSPTWDQMKKDVASGVKMAEIEFNIDAFGLKFEGSNEVFNLYLEQESKHRWYGIAIRNDNLVVIHATIKHEKVKMKLYSKTHKEKYEGEFDSDTNNFIVA